MEFKQDYYGLIVFFLIDVAFAVWWVRARLGLDKRWFVSPTPYFISSSFYFALPTFILGFAIGLVGMLLVVLDPNSNLALYLFFVTFGLLGSSFIFAYLEPDWMSPDWYKWLKREHGDILPYLIEKAHQMGRKAWLAQVETQEDLEQWVKDFRRKHGL